MRRMTTWMLCAGLVVAVAGCTTPPAGKGDADATTTTTTKEDEAPLTPSDPLALENLLPERTLVYASIDNIADARQKIDATALGRILAEEEVQTFLAKPLGQLRKVIDQVKAQTGIVEEDIYAAFGGQVAAALLELKPRERSAPDFSFVVAARVTNSKAALSFATWFCDFMKKQNPRTGDVKRPGWTGLTSSPSRDDIQVFAGVNEKMAVFAALTAGNGAFGEFLDAIDGTANRSLADSAEYLQAVKRVGAQRLCISYVALEALKSSILELARAEEAEGTALAERVIEAAGLNGAKSVASTWCADPPGIMQRTFVHAPAPRTGVFDLLPPGPLSQPTIELAGGETMSYTAGSFSFSKIMGLARTIADVLGGRAQVDQAMAQAKAMTGVDFEADLLAQLGDEVAFMMFPPEVGGGNMMLAGLGGLTLVFQVKDAARFEGLLVKLLGVADMGLQAGNAGMMKELPYKGVTIRYAMIQGGFVAPSAAIVGDRFVLSGGIASTKEVVRMVLDGPDAPITKNPRFTEALSHVGGEVGPSLTYADPKQSVVTAMQLAGTAAGLVGLGLSVEEQRRSPRREPPPGEVDIGTWSDWVDLALLPSPRSITRHLFDQVGTSAYDDEGLMFTSYGPLGGMGAISTPNMGSTATVAVIAAIAIPNLVQSRVASNETSAVASCIVILAGQATFHKTDFYGKGELVYANKRDGNGIVDMYKLPDGKMVGLIDRSLAEALKGNMPKAGYYLADITKAADGTEYEPAIEFAVCAVPAEYDRGGRNIFIMDVGGTVYQADAQVIFPEVTTGERVPFVTKYPSDEELNTKWIAVGNG